MIGLSFRHHENRGQEKTLSPKSINIETHSKAALAFIHKRVGVKFMQHCFVMLTWLFLSFCPNVRALKWNQLWSWKEISQFIQTDTSTAVFFLAFLTNLPACLFTIEELSISEPAPIQSISRLHTVLHISPLSNMIAWIFPWIFPWIYPKISACCSLRNLC